MRKHTIKKCIVTGDFFVARFKIVAHTARMYPRINLSRRYNILDRVYFRLGYKLLMRFAAFIYAVNFFFFFFLGILSYLRIFRLFIMNKTIFVSLNST